MVKIVKNLKDSSAGWDAISPNIFKLSFEKIVEPFTHICNLSLQNGVFPSEMKIAKVCPIFKNGNVMLFTQYRPVSVLPVMSKVLEKIMYDRLYAFLIDMEILYEYQFGFRPSFSTYLALIMSVDKITTALERGNYVLGVFLDFSKAFDTIDHDILLKKLDYYGVRGIALEWFRSYLLDRSQYVSYDGVSSSKQRILCGVPQGSILGPLLFLVYVNDLAYIIQELYTIMYADDSNLFNEGPDLHVLEFKMNESLKDISLWLKVNKLSLNIDKTHFLIFKNRRKLIDYEPIIMIDSKVINRVYSTKCLGGYVDDSLTWKCHIDHVCKKISKGIGILTKARKYLNKRTLQQLYYTFIYPYLSYCNHVWGNTYSTYLKRLTLLQKRALRIITFSGFREHTDVLFQNLKILKIREINKHLLGQFVYKYSENMLPRTFNGMFRLNADIHSYNTRSANKFHVNVVKSDLGKRSIRHTSILLWNSIADTIGQATSLGMFKSQLKMFLLNKQ